MTVLAAVAWAAVSAVYGADVVLKNGGRLAGDIGREDDTGVVLHMAYGTITLRWAEISEIRRTASPAAPAKPVEKPAPLPVAADAPVKPPAESPAEPPRPVTPFSPGKAPAAKSGGAGSGVVAPRDMDRVWEVLKLYDGTSGEYEKEVMEMLVDLPGGVPALMNALNGEWGGGLPEPRELSVARRAILLRAVALREADFLYWIRTLATGSEGISMRLVAMRAAGELPSEGALAVLMEVASGIESPHFVQPSIAGPFEDGLSAILARDAEAFKSLRDAWPALDNALLGPITRAALRADPAEAAVFLREALGEDAERDIILLAQVQSANLRAEKLDGLFLEKIRRLLRNREASVRRSAVQTLGKLLDRGSIPDFIGSLEDDDPLVKQGAHWALTNLSGFKLPPSPDRWKEWYLSTEEGARDGRF